MAASQQDAPEAAVARLPALVIMWGYLFFIPLPLGRWAPDGIGWLLVLAGSLALRGRYRGGRALIPVAVAGLAVWTCAVLVPAAYGSAGALRGLLIVRWGLLATVSWVLCAVAADVAEAAQMPALAASVRWRRWACPVAFALLAAAPVVPPQAEVVHAAAFLVASVAAVTIMMGLMARILRLGSLPSGRRIADRERATAGPADDPERP